MAVEDIVYVVSGTEISYLLGRYEWEETGVVLTYKNTDNNNVYLNYRYSDQTWIIGSGGGKQYNGYGGTEDDATICTWEVAYGYPPMPIVTKQDDGGGDDDEPASNGMMLLW